jgi:hypothetical protein
MAASPRRRRCPSPGVARTGTNMIVDLAGSTAPALVDRPPPRYAASCRHLTPESGGNAFPLVDGAITQYTRAAGVGWPA